MARMTQINIDASRLQGVDLSQVPNPKFPLKKADNTQLNPLSAQAAKASVSAAASVSTVGEWAAIPQDFGRGSLKATMVLPRSTAGAIMAPTPVPLPPLTMGITIGFSPVVVLGLTASGGLYLQLSPNEFGLLGSMGFEFATSLGLSVPVDVLIVDGPISLLDGLGIMITVDVGFSKTVFAGMGLLVTLPSWKIIGFVFEFGAGDTIGPPVTLNVSLTYGGHIAVL